MSLNIAARALTTNQSVLQVIGHNISNANTVGYSRQSVSLEAVAGQKVGNGYFGKGVELTSVKRSYDAFLTKQANNTATVAAGNELRYQKMQQIEALFPLGEGSLGTQLNNALNAWVDVQASPSDSTARGVVISRADELAARVRDTAARLDEIGRSARLQSTEVVKAINQLATQFADLNRRVVSGLASGQPPNDLLDQRDKVLAELNKRINVSTVTANDGSQTLFVANSYPLVLGSQAASLMAMPDPADSSRQTIHFVQGTTNSLIADDAMTGGHLKGLQDFINKDVSLATAQLGRMALTVASELNAQQLSGLTLDGTPGQEIFTFGNALTSSGALGFRYGGQPGGFLNVAVSDASKLEADAYEVTMTSASNATITRVSDGVTLAVNQPISSALSAVGLTLEEGVPASLGAGQIFLISPAADTAESIAVALSSPTELAAASRLVIAPALTNTGVSAIESSFVSLTRGDMPVTPIPSFTLTFNSGSSQFSLSAPTPPGTVTTPVPISYTPGKPMVFEYDDGSGPPSNRFSYNVTLRGEPANNDSFSLSQTPTGAIKFNAGNAQAVLALRDKTVFDGNVSMADGYVPVFSSVASTLSETKFSAEFSSAQAASAETQRANKAGVNLDEEAALLIQYQQAYQASAKYMGTVQSIFDTLMSAFR